MKATCTSVTKDEQGKDVVVCEAEDQVPTTATDEKTGKSTTAFKAERKVLAIFHLSAAETAQELYKEGEEYEIVGHEFR